MSTRKRSNELPCGYCMKGNTGFFQPMAFEPVDEFLVVMAVSRVAMAVATLESWRAKQCGTSRVASREEELRGCQNGVVKMECRSEEKTKVRGDGWREAGFREENPQCGGFEKACN